MSNIIDYIEWRGDLSFSKAPINSIDALIFCQISYLDFSSILNELDFSKRYSLRNLAEKFKMLPDFTERSYMGVLINKLTVQLFLDAANSERFGEIEVTGFSSINNIQKEEQFSATTFILPDGTNYVAFRGTDDTIVGWKEDFNLAVYDRVPAQVDAVNYVELLSKTLSGKIILGGHSKGGNLSVFAAANSSAKIKKRIIDVYNFDGPGFSAKVLDSDSFKDVIPKIHSFYPHFSVVGMLFEHAGPSSVVESDENGIMQHDPFSWHLKGIKFIELPEVEDGSIFLHNTFNNWISVMNEEQLSKFVSTLFSIIQACDARTNTEIEKNLLANSMKIIKALMELDDESQNMLKETVRQLFKCANRNLPPLPWESK